MKVLRDFQEEALFKLFEFFEQNSAGHPLVAMPTGTGKGTTLAMFIARVLQRWPSQRIIAATHDKKLITQNLADLLEIWPTAPYGVYSAGLNQKNYMMPIVFGGIQSMVKQPECFGWRDLFIIDEAHLLSPKDSGRYKRVLKALFAINPAMRVIGFTATTYRMGQGSLVEPSALPEIRPNGEEPIDDRIFTDICFDITGMEAFNRLIAQGWLCPLISTPTETQYDVSNVSITNGDYNAKQLEDTVNSEEQNFEAVREMVAAGRDRRAWLVFTSGINHANDIATMLGRFGIIAAAVHSGQSKAYNDEVLHTFKHTDDIRAIVSRNMITTGFNAPKVDLIAMLRHTVSPGLWVQMLGRGTRPLFFPGFDVNIFSDRMKSLELSEKKNCLVLDYANNTLRLGPINDPVKPRPKGQKSGDVPIKICETEKLVQPAIGCGAYNHTTVRLCTNCGCEFIFKNHIQNTHSNAEVLRSDAPVIEMFNVDRVIYNRGRSGDKPPYIKVNYHCGLRAFNEIVCLEHPGWAGKRARDWWRQRYPDQFEPPPTTDIALEYVASLKIPVRIQVHLNKKYPEIMSVEF